MDPALGRLREERLPESRILCPRPARSGMRFRGLDVAKVRGPSQEHPRARRRSLYPHHSH